MTATLQEPAPVAPVDVHVPTTGRASGLALSAFAAAVGTVIGARRLSDNSFLTHLATGRLILDHGFPHSDPYTFTAAGHGWVVQSWFASVLYALADRAGDLGGVRVLTAVLAAAVSVVCWRLTAPARSPIARLLVWAPAAVVGGGFWVERPLLIGLLLLGLVLLAAEGGLDRRWLLPIGWVWLNTHGSWPLALAALAALAVGHRFDGDRAASTSALTALKWLGGGLVLGSLNPYGPRLLVFPVELLSRREALQSVTEWQAPRFDSPPQLAFLVLIALAVVGLQRRPSWATTLPLVLFTAAALVGARNLPVAAIVLLPGLARSFAGLGGFSERLEARQGRIVAVAALALTAVAVSGVAGSAAFEGRSYPVAATEYLESAGLAPTQARVIAEDSTGNFFEARYGAGAGTFIDDRVEVTSDQVVEDYLTLLAGERGWDDVLDRYDAKVVVWSKTAPLVQLLALSPAWERAYADARFAVYVRVPNGATGD